MRCKIVRTQKFMWRNIMRSTKSQKASVLHYSIDLKKIKIKIARGSQAHPKEEGGGGVGGQASRLI